MLSLICLKCNKELLNLEAAEMHDCSDTGERKSDVDNIGKITLESFPREEQVFDNDRNKFAAVHSNPMKRLNKWEMSEAKVIQNSDSSSWSLSTESYLQHFVEKIPFANCIQMPEKEPVSDLINFDKFTHFQTKLQENTTAKICASANASISGSFPENAESRDNLTSSSSNIQGHPRDRNLFSSFTRQLFLPDEQPHSHTQSNVPNHAFAEKKQNVENEELLESSSIDLEQGNASRIRFSMNTFALNSSYPLTGLSLANSTTANVSTSVPTVQISKGNNHLPPQKSFDGIDSNSNDLLYQDKTSNDYSFSSDSLTAVEKYERHLCKTKFHTESEASERCDTALNNDHISCRHELEEKDKSITLIRSGASDSGCEKNSEELGNSFIKHDWNASAVKSSQNHFNLDKRSPKDCLSIHEKKPNRKRLYHCNECKMILDESILIAHKRLHVEEKILKQDECLESLVKERDLTEDTFLRKKGRFKCFECSKTFSCSNNLNRHKRIHTGEKPYECNDCQRAFNQKDNLHAHKRLHSGTKLFECSKCVKKFARKDCLKKHKCA